MMSNLITPNQYFNEIFCINLSKATERWNITSQKFKREDIYVTRFEGIDKDELQHAFNQHIKRNPKSMLNRLGRYAIWCTFSKLFEYVMDSNIEKFLIFEDDVLFHKDFKQLFDHQCKKIPQNWDMWYLGSTQVNTLGMDFNSIKDFYKSNNSTYGMFGIGIKTSFLKANYARYSKGFKNNDHFFASDIDKTNVYVSWPQLIGHQEGYSYNAGYLIDEKVTQKRKYLYYDPEFYH